MLEKGICSVPAYSREPVTLEKGRRIRRGIRDGPLANGFEYFGHRRSKRGTLLALLCVNALLLRRQDAS